MSNCHNCDAKIGKPLIGSENKEVTPLSVLTLNDFLPNKLKRSSFCEKCSTYKPKVESPHIYVKYKEHYKDLALTLKKKRSELEDLSSQIILEKGSINFNHNDLVMYSNTPANYELIEFVESYIIVDSGMWSTSSDNLDAMWSAVHDSVARIGVESENKLSKGFSDSKYLLKKAAFIIGGNCVVDIKHSFSDLAGNGKILIHCQGTAAIDNSRPIPSFVEIDLKYKEQLDIITTEVNTLEKELNTKSLEHFSNLIKSIKFKS
jgi:hypothetical protein